MGTHVTVGETARDIAEYITACAKAGMGLLEPAT